MGTWRKAYGALKDSTKVGLAKVNSDYKDLDVAIVKATTHVECPPHEKHVRKIFASTSIIRPRADVAYCIYALGRRLSKTRNWVTADVNIDSMFEQTRSCLCQIGTDYLQMMQVEGIVNSFSVVRDMVALKTLIVIHRTLREGDPTFREEMLSYSRRGSILHISNFKDDSGPLAWDCSAWVRTYAHYLEERLECFRVLKYDIETERLMKSPQGRCPIRTLCCLDLLEQLPALQQLLYRLVGCQPEGAAYGNFLIQYALALVLKESFKIYCAINDRIINLMDMYFEMSKYDAVKALEIYKRAGQQAEALSEFYELCKNLEISRNFQFPILRQAPASFLATMEEYIREAPRSNSALSKTPEYKDKLLACKQQVPPTENEKPDQKVEEPPQGPVVEQPPEPKAEPEAQSPATSVDLLRLDEINSAAAKIEHSNALALAIISPDDSKPSTTCDLLGADSSGWELALVTAPSSNTDHLVESKMAGGFDRLLLDSLYEDAAWRQEAAAAYSGYNLESNPFDYRDPCPMSNSIAPPLSVQMALMEQQQQQSYYYYYQQQQMQQNYYLSQEQHEEEEQQQFQTHQNMMMVPCQPQHQRPLVNSSNPFGDPFVGFPQGATIPQDNQNLL